MRRQFVSVLLLTVLALPTRAADEELYRPPLEKADIDSLIGTDFYGVYVKDRQAGWKKNGWGRETLELINEDKPFYRIEFEMRFEINVLGQELKLTALSREEFDAEAPYTFRGGLERQDDGEDTQEVRVIRDDEGFQVTISTGEDTLERHIDALDYTLADRLAVERWVAIGAHEGDHITMVSFDFDRLDLGRIRHEWKGEQTEQLGGVDVTYAELRSEDLTDGIITLGRNDRADGELLWLNEDGLVELRREPEKIAKKLEAGADLFESSSITIDEPLGDEYSIEALILEVVVEGENPLKSGPGQELVRGDDGTLLLKVGPTFGTEIEATEEEIQDALAETVAYPISHPKVQALAKRAVGKAKTDEHKVERLLRFVNKYIEPSYTSEPLNLLRLLEEREGDCSEYALLFTTLARAAGVPCREVGGVLYMGDGHQSFGPHAWNEVVLDGKWVPVDASIPQRRVDPTHVRFGSGEGEQSVAFAAAIAGLSFRVVEIRREE